MGKPWGYGGRNQVQIAARLKTPGRHREGKLGCETLPRTQRETEGHTASARASETERKSRKPRQTQLNSRGGVLKGKRKNKTLNE